MDDGWPAYQHPKFPTRTNLLISAGSTQVKLASAELRKSGLVKSFAGIASFLNRIFEFYPHF